MKTIGTIITTALFIGASLASHSAMAQQPACTDSELARLEASAGKMTDAAKKAAVMKHISAARDQMSAQKLENCLISIQAAHSMMSGG